MATILYFGVARDLAGTAEEELDIAGATSVGALWQLLAARHPRIAEIRSICRIAVDMKYAGDEAAVGERSEIAIIPPVAGG